MESTSNQLLFLHGAGDTRRYWDPLIFHCVEDTFDSITSTNLACHPLKITDIPENALTIDFFADEILRKIIAPQAQTNLGIVGHSLGALVAMKLCDLLIDTASYKRISVLAGDPPLFLNNATPCQRHAKASLLKTEAGRNMLLNSLPGLADGSNNNHLNLIENRANHCNKTLIFGSTLTPFTQNQALGSTTIKVHDRGAFNSEQDLAQLKDLPRIKPDQLHTIPGSGHHLFYSKAGLQFFRQWQKQVTSATKPITTSQES